MGFIESLESRRLFSASLKPFAAPTQGLAALYYANSDFTGASATRTDPQINFNWAGGSPVPGVLGGKNFSARWTGNVIAKYNQTYTFTVQARDGVRLWVNGNEIFGDWTVRTAVHTDNGTVALTAGRPTSIRLEYYDGPDPGSIKLYWSSKSTPFALVPTTALQPVIDPMFAEIDSTLAFAAKQLNVTVAALKGNTAIFPGSTAANGTWNTWDRTNWTSGFFPAELWQMYKQTKNVAWENLAKAWTLPLAPDDTYTDDVMVRVFNAYYPLYLATGNPAYKAVIIKAAASRFSTWNSAVGALESRGIPSHSGNPNANFGVLMDHMMDESLLFWAAKQTGNAVWKAEALQHARTVAKYFFRPDGSVAMWSYFNKTTGQFIDNETTQGYSDTSDWARAQAWAIYGFSVVYRETGAPDMLAAAQRVADFFYSQLPADHIPYWDFSDPAIPNTFRDTSAAAIAASGLIQLSRLETNPTLAATYLGEAKNILTSLMSPQYLAKGTNSEGILLHGAWYVPRVNWTDQSLVFGDYYFIEALNEYRGLVSVVPGT